MFLIVLLLFYSTMGGAKVSSNYCSITIIVKSTVYILMRLKRYLSRSLLLLLPSFLWHLVLHKSFGRRYKIPPFFTVLNCIPVLPTFQGPLPQHPANFFWVSRSLYHWFPIQDCSTYIILASPQHVSQPLDPLPPCEADN